MPIYKLTSARLLVETYGSYCHPMNRDPSHLLAEYLDDSEPLQIALDAARNAWSIDAANSEVAMTEAKQYVDGRLSSTGAGYKLLAQLAPTYRPILNAQGVPIGHETIVWLYRTSNNTPHSLIVEGEYNSFDYGLVGTVFLAVNSQ